MFPVISNPLIIVSVSMTINCHPPSSYKLMQQCWRLNPDERPSASNLVHLFEECSDADSENYLTVAATDGEDGTHIDISDDDTSLRLEESVASCEIEPCTVEISDIENGEYQNVTNHTSQVNTFILSILRLLQFTCRKLKCEIQNKQGYKHSLSIS